MLLEKNPKFSSLSPPSIFHNHIIPSLAFTAYISSILREPCLQIRELCSPYQSLPQSLQKLTIIILNSDSGGWWVQSDSTVCWCQRHSERLGTLHHIITNDGYHHSLVCSATVECKVNGHSCVVGWSWREEMISHESHTYKVCIFKRVPPVAVPSTVCRVTTTSLAREPLCTDTLTGLETVLSVSVKV